MGEFIDEKGPFGHEFYSRHNRDGYWEWVDVEDEIPWRVVTLSNSGWGTLGHGTRTGQTPGWFSVGYSADDWFASRGEGWIDCDPEWFGLQWKYLRPRQFQNSDEMTIEYFGRCRNVLDELSNRFIMQGQRPLLNVNGIKRGVTTKIGDLGTMYFHGVGITVYENSGAVVGFDWEGRGLPCASQWSLQEFSESCGAFFTPEEIKQSIGRMVRDGRIALINDGSFLIPLH